MPTASLSGFERWKHGVDQAVGDPRWSRHDCAVLTTVAAFQLHLQRTRGWQPIDPAWIKAMLWVETGAGSAEWHRKPLQIGVPGDAGLGALLSGQEGGDEVLPPGWRTRLAPAAILSIPESNIAAGVGYLAMRLANYEFQSVPNAGSRIVTRIVRVGDSLDRIARLEGSTTDWLKHLNHGIGVIRAGDIVHVQPASMVRTITGWRQITAKLLQARYNGDRDLRYAQKIEHALAIVRSVGISACAR